MGRNAFLVLALGVLISSCATTPKQKEKELTSEEKAAHMIGIARGSLIEGDPTGALATLMEAEKLDDGNPSLYHLMSIAYFRKSDYVSAIRFSEKALDLNPKLSSVSNTLGKLYLDSGQYKKAEPHLLRAASDPINRQAYLARTSLGILHFQKGNYGASKYNLNIAIRDEPVRACVARYYRGQLLAREAKLEKAIKDYRLATVNACTNYVEAHFALGIAYRRLKRYDEAKKKFIEVSQLFPDSKYADLSLENIKDMP